MKKYELERKLKEVYDFTADFIEKNGFSPSVREVCEKLKIKSTATAYSYINKLKSKGWLNQSPSKKRTISLPLKSTQYKTIPLVGTVTAGSPILAVENLEGYYPLPPDFSSEEDVFALKVKGESMINAGIYDKDIIIVKEQSTAENGEIVVALIEDSATVKRFFKGKDKIILHPENDSMKDMVFDDVLIIGIVKGLYRKF